MMMMMMMIKCSSFKICRPAICSDYLVWVGSRYHVLATECMFHELAEDASQEGRGRSDCPEYTKIHISNAIVTFFVFCVKISFVELQKDERFLL